MVLVQKRPFFQLFFFRQYKPGKFFYDIPQKKKNAFKTWKRKFSESLTNGSFLKGFVHGFGRRIELFYVHCLGKLSKKKSFFDIMTKKESFWYQKN